ISTFSEQIVSAALNLEELQNYREKFPFLKDGDDFGINF
ncbi:MAG: nitrilase family protein, partial [Chryseobacterium sp.]|nr:nitrilase family protein [Chryseobacterium sp.]